MCRNHRDNGKLNSPFQWPECSPWGTTGQIDCRIHHEDWRTRYFLFIFDRYNFKRQYVPSKSKFLLTVFLFGSMSILPLFDAGLNPGKNDKQYFSLRSIILRTDISVIDAFPL